MTIQEINKAYERIIGSLDRRELKDAFTFLQGMIAGIHEYTFQEKLTQLQDTYTYMLRYRMEGAKDPMQESIYHTLLTSTYELADQVQHKALKTESPLAYYNTKRSLAVSPQPGYERLHAMMDIPFDSPELQKQYEGALSLLFQKIWVSEALNTDEVLAIKEILFNPVLPDTAGCQVVSALYMGLQAAFDKEKLLLLFDAVLQDNEAIRTRALINILLTLYTYRKRTELYPQIEERLATVAETYPALTSSIRTITLRFILARETEKITKRLQEEIIPEMMKLAPEVHKKINLRDLSPEQMGDEMNPEWENMLAGTSLEKKMQEFGELQQEGADVMHSTFVHLKNFPFFRELGNWFLPFTPNHSSLADHTEVGEKQMLSSLSIAPFMCDSDKYSFFFTIRLMPEQQRKMMMRQYEGQTEEMIRQNKEELITQQNKVDVIAGQYIQDLYRFYKLYPGKLDFTDIFTLTLDFHNLPILQPYISDKETLTAIAEYYLHKAYYKDALIIYRRLIADDPDSYILLQKIGYCLQMDGDIRGALASYLHADLLNTESKWVIRRIAGCYRTLKQPGEALAYYQRYEALEPEDLGIQMSIGHCYLEMKEYDQALKYYFKVDYLDHKNTKAWRPIAWCSFLTGKYDQARNYYHKIIEAHPTLQDYLNAGHTEWALQNIKNALYNYKQAVKMEDGDFQKFREQFTQDIPDLLHAGIEEKEVPLMLDQLRYLLEEGL